MSQDQTAEPQSGNPAIVPGMVRCAKCNFVLSRTILYVGSGTSGPGDNETEPCPNGCGPLWPMSWKQMSADLEQRCIEQMDRARQAEQANEKLRTVLLQHHEWHNQIGTVLFPAENGQDGPIEIDLSEAYQEGTLCTRTMEALS